MNTATATAYPLTWPEQFPRTKHREKSSFRTGLPSALKNVQSSLKLFAQDSGKSLQSLTISSNCTLGVDDPTDSGVAVWFKWDGLQLCIPVDRYFTVAENLQAIHHIIEARRVELRHGTLALVRASFAGFLSLPAPTKKTAWEILEIAPSSTPEQVKAAYRTLAAKHHPDRGGNASSMAEINAAYEQIKSICEAA